jgi:hypothetical protein
LKKISSGSTSFHKRVFPFLWYGALAAFVAVGVLDRAWEKDVSFLVIPCVMAVIGYFVMKKMVWDLADEVYDCGDTLLVRMQGLEERVALANVINVNSSTRSNPQRITLRLATPGRFGNEISFAPVVSFSLNPLVRNAVAEDLIVRVDRARSRRAF